MKRNNARGFAAPVFGLPGQPSPGWSPAAAHDAWRVRLAALATACAGSYPEDEGDRIRDVHQLLAAAPSPGLITGLAVPTGSRIDRLIASGAGASAVLAMLGEGSGYLVSRGEAGEHLASVVLPGADEDASACGDTLALALVGAIARALAGAPATPV